MPPHTGILPGSHCSMLELFLEKLGENTLNNDQRRLVARVGLLLLVDGGVDLLAYTFGNSSAIDRLGSHDCTAARKRIGGRSGN